MSRAVIGICAAVEQARFGPWDQRATLLPESYARAIQDAGGIALLLPPDEFDWRYVNYAPITVGAVLLIVGVWWAVSAKHTFKGPVRTVEFDEGAGIQE